MDFSRRARAAIALATLGLAASWSPPAAGDPAAPAAASAAPAPVSDAAKVDAERHYAEARALYGRGEYRAAIVELDEALRSDPDGKELVYNLAIVHEKLGEVEDAARFYERYLTMETDDKEKDRVRAILRRLEGARREVKAPPAASVVVVASPAAASAPPAASAVRVPVANEAPPPPSRGRLDAWVWGTGALAVGAVAVGTVMGIKALSDRPGQDPTTTAGTSIDDLQASADRAHREAIVSDLGFVVALVSASASAWLYFSRFDRPASVPDRAGLVPSVTLGPAGAAGSVAVRF